MFQLIRVLYRIILPASTDCTGKGVSFVGQCAGNPIQAPVFTAPPCPGQPLGRSDMSALFSTIDRPAVTRTPGAFSRLFGTCRDGIARYFVHRAAIARLREFDDAELRDVGLARSQIEQAVRGLDTTFPDWPRR
jgi:uncharacterized protein YjiS (DUF1127 family)